MHKNEMDQYICVYHFWKPTVSTPVILTKKKLSHPTHLRTALRFSSPRFSRSNWTAAMHKDEMDQYICVNHFWKPPVSRSSSGFLCRVASGHILSDWTKWLHITQQNFLYHYLSVCRKRHLWYKKLNVEKSVVHFFLYLKRTFCLLLVVTIAGDHWVTFQDLNSWVPAFFWLIKDDIAILMVYCFAFKRVLRNVKRPFKRRGYKILSYNKARKKEKNITNILSVTSDWAAVL